MPRALTARLASCPYANSFHEAARGATSEPFFRKEDDPMNGHWLHKCLASTHERVEPLPSLGPGDASNMACVSDSGMYRRPHNQSVLVHFLKHASAMDYAHAVLTRLRRGDALPPTDSKCCAKKVWPTSLSARRIPESVCAGLLPVEGAGASGSVPRTVS